MSAEPEINWDDLWEKVKRGDRVAQEEFFLILSVRLRALLQYKLWGWSNDDRLELVQETLTVLFLKKDQVIDNPHLFALKILHNKIGHAMRARSKSQKTLVSQGLSEEVSQVEAFIKNLLARAPMTPDFVKTLELEELNDQIREAVKQMSQFCRSFFLAILEGYSIQELWLIFRRLEPDLRRSTFDKRIYDCRQKLIKLVKDSL